MFAPAGDDTNIFWIGYQREVATTFAAIKNTEITKESTRSYNTVRVNAINMVFDTYNLIGRDMYFAEYHVYIYRIVRYDCSARENGNAAERSEQENARCNPIHDAGDIIARNYCALHQNGNRNNNDDRADDGRPQNSGT